MNRQSLALVGVGRGLHECVPDRFGLVSTQVRNRRQRRFLRILVRQREADDCLTVQFALATGIEGDVFHANRRLAVSFGLEGRQGQFRLFSRDVRPDRRDRRSQAG